MVYYTRENVCFASDTVLTAGLAVIASTYMNYKKLKA
jgi:hypothetical protein